MTKSKAFQKLEAAYVRSSTKVLESAHQRRDLLPDRSEQELFNEFSADARALVSYALSAPGWDVEMWHYDSYSKLFYFNYDGSARITKTSDSGDVIHLSARLYFDPLQVAELDRLRAESRRCRDAGALMERETLLQETAGV